MQETRTFVTPPGGIMTKEVGAITGAVEAWIEDDQVRIRYEGALDTYTVGEAAGRDLDQIVRLLSVDPGSDSAGNPGAATI